ncbi:hypothetical protein BPOR_0306g00120 [Botrytis porri]|uniref:Uncharacterized protein n=1 Tax=Botrytis porri TaxID=87229 RepID=A0A4Z1KQS9_9HELO|nr:hypothetical protein BPOR_0306g00120 [Botrytis porri]
MTKGHKVTGLSVSWYYIMSFDMSVTVDVELYCGEKEEAEEGEAEEVEAEEEGEEGEQEKQREEKKVESSSPP